MATTRRIYIGGLAEHVTPQELQQRFQLFGQSERVQVAQQQDTPLCRGFAYMDLTCTPAEWNRCLSTLNGSKWKGKVIKIEAAHPSYEQRHDS
jgi:RNA recognition motif-containing protein